MIEKVWPLISKLKLFLREDGQDIIEYVMIVGLLALGVLTAANSPGQKLNDAIISIANAINADTQPRQDSAHTPWNREPRREALDEPSST